MSLRNIFSTENLKNITYALFGDETRHRTAVIDEEFGDETTFIEAGSRVHYFLKSNKIDNETHNIRLMTHGFGLTSILPAPWIGMRYHQISDLGVFNEAGRRELFEKFEANKPLTAFIDAKTDFLVELVTADASRSDRRTLKPPGTNFDHFPN